jgi:hypothetical protein
MREIIAFVTRTFPIWAQWRTVRIKAVSPFSVINRINVVKEVGGFPLNPIACKFFGHSPDGEFPTPVAGSYPKIALG